MFICLLALAVWDYCVWDRSGSSVYIKLLF
jgi:hypothetical protein